MDIENIYDSILHHMKKILLLILGLYSAFNISGQTPVSFTINVNNGRKPISPFIYGTNTYQAISTDLLNPTITRFGGNRASTYNWETNASNAGSDYIYNSDSWWVGATGINISLGNISGSVIQAQVDSAKKVNRANIVTLQALGYVAADENGPVSCYAPCNRWIPIFSDKPGQSYQYPPDKTDNAVYCDEEMAWLLKKYGPASSGGIKYYQIDNEPDLWQSTHSYIQKKLITPIELAQKNEAFGKMIRRMDPSGRILGFSSYGWYGLVTVDLKTYLTEMKTRSNAYGKPLIDIFDWHFYPNDLQNFTGNKTWDLLQAPRTLWDSKYYIAGGGGPMGYYGQAPQLIRRYNNIINQEFAGLRMSISEWNASYDESSIYTGLYVSDILGVYGQENIEVATYFDRPSQYAATGFKLFTNFDGNNSTYGDTYVEAITSDLPNATIYASTESASNDGKLHVVVISKNMNGSVSGTFTINGSKSYTKAEVYYFDGSSQNIKKAADITAITSNAFTYTLPQHSAVHFVLSSPVSPVVNLILPANNSSTCQGTIIPLTATASVAHGINKVDFYDGTNLLGTSIISPYTFNWINASIGSHSLTAKVTYTSGVISNSSAVTLTVNARPISPGATATASYCQNATASPLSATGTGLQWYSVPTGGTVLTTTPTPITTAIGTTNYYVSQTTNGCESNRAMIAVSVNAAPTATITPAGATTFCTGGSVVLTASAGSSYKWMNGTTQVGTNVSYTATTSGSYTVEVINAGGCNARSTTTTVTINATPTATITAGGTTTFCTGGSVVLTASAGSSYKWMNGTSQVGTNASYTATTSGSYTVEVTNAGGCNATSAVIQVNTTAATVWYQDTDGDGKGDASSTKAGCTQPSGYVSTAGDTCPTDPNKFTAGNCGCNKSETECLDCAGIVNGTAVLDNCNICTGGTTGKIACVSTASINGTTANIKVIPQPFDSNTRITITNLGMIQSFTIISASGALVETRQGLHTEEIIIGDDLTIGLYSVIIQTETGVYTTKIVKK
jgi:hypothetical protein